jgi:hypothetical protein
MEIYNNRDVKVLEGAARVAQPPTTYVFAGPEGSQEPGTGMLYNRPPTACAVRDAADAHLLAVYSSSMGSLRTIQRRRSPTLVVSRARRFA